MPCLVLVEEAQAHDHRFSFTVVIVFSRSVCFCVCIWATSLVLELFWVSSDDALLRGVVLVVLGHSGGVIGRCLLLFVEISVAEAVRVWNAVEVTIVAGYDVLVKSRNRHAFEKWENAALATEVVMDYW